MLSFAATFGNVQKKVIISQPHGSGGGQYLVLIDNYYHGTLVKYKGEWVLHGNNIELTGDDIRILGEMIDNS